MKHRLQEKPFKDIKELWVKNIKQDKFFNRILGVQVMYVLALF